jgi:hypothetical protein
MTLSRLLVELMCERGVYSELCYILGSLAFLTRSLRMSPKQVKAARMTRQTAACESTLRLDVFREALRLMFCTGGYARATTIASQTSPGQRGTIYST